MMRSRVEPAESEAALRSEVERDGESPKTRELQAQAPSPSRHGGGEKGAAARAEPWADSPAAGSSGDEGGGGQPQQRAPKLRRVAVAEDEEDEEDEP